MNPIQFSNDHLSMVISFLPNDRIDVRGQIRSPGNYDRMEIVAPCPIDRRTSYAGSGLPFPCPNQAMDNTPNRTTPTSEGKFQAVFEYPNSYYLYDAATKINPSVFAVLSPRDTTKDTIYIRFELPEQSAILHCRSLTHRAERRAGPIFYHSKDAIDPIPDSAEHVMLTLKHHKEVGHASV